MCAVPASIAKMRMKHKSLIAEACFAALLAQAVCASAFAAPPGDARQSVITVPGPKGPLEGALLVPVAASGPSVLIVPGSGPTDRDGNGPIINTATYQRVAEGLAARGISTLRIDKRGLFGSAKAIDDPNAVTTADYAADVKKWAGALKRETGASCVWLLGHSEGGLISLLAGQDPAVCGLLLVATAGRPMGEVLRAQIRANPANAPILDQALPAIDALEAGRRFDTADMHPALKPLFDPKVQGFLIDAFAVDPAKLIQEYSKPILVLQAQRDLQVSADEAARLAKAAPGAMVVTLPNTNHVLKTVTTDDVAINVATYANPTLPLAPGVIDAIASFIVSKTVRP